MTLDFSFFKIKVRVHLGFLIAAGALFFLFTERAAELRTPAMFLATLGILAQGILMHELGHAFVARAFGLHPRVELLTLGGRTWWESLDRLSPWRSLLISAGGPAVGLILGAPALVWAMAQHAWIGPKPTTSPEATYALGLFFYVNFGWALFNLLPVLPLDGGNILAAIFEGISPRHGRRIARFVSLALLGGAAATVLALLPWSDPATLMLLLFIALFVFTNYRAMRMEDELARRIADGSIVVVAGGRQEMLERAQRALEAGDGRAVATLAAHLIASARDADARDEGLHLLAWGRLLAGDPDEASATLRALSGRREPDPALSGAILLAQGRAAEALPWLWASLEAGPGDPFVEKRITRALEESQAWHAADTPLREHAHQLSPETLERLQTSAFTAGRLSLSQALGERAFESTRSPLSALDIARSLARRGLASEALDWIRRAAEAGLDDLERLDTDDDLEAVRALPDWSAFRASLG